MGGGGGLISVYPEELNFEFELEKVSYCNIKVVNNTEHHVAFKVKTTSPKKYLVRPNTSVVQPWDSCTVKVTLQAQMEYPPDMQCKDKFLIQSTKVLPITDADELPPDTFNKVENKVIEEMKLRVVYTAPGQSGRGNSEDESGLPSTAARRRESNMVNDSNTDENQSLQRLKEERDSTIQQNKQLQREMELLRRRRDGRSGAGFTLTFAALAGLVGLLIGFILRFTLSTPPSA